MNKEKHQSGHLLQYVSVFFQIRNLFYNDFVLVQSFTSTQAATCRELELSLIFQAPPGRELQPPTSFHKASNDQQVYNYSYSPLWISDQKLQS